MIADRMHRIDSSGIRRVFDLAAALDDPINLSIGQPDFDVPDTVKETAIAAIQDGHNTYTVSQGIPELRAAVRDYLKAQERLGAHTDHEVIITSGSTGGLFLAILALVNPGDEVIIPDPYFVMYKHFVNLISGVPVYVDTYPDFHLTPEKLETHITPKTKMVILNSPANPTGMVYSRAQNEALMHICNEKGIWVISDEVYSTFCYDDAFHSPYPCGERAILLDGFSKSHAMLGWRIGYASGPAHVIQEMIKLQQYTYICAPSFAQKAAIHALTHDMTTYVDAYRKKRDMVYEGLKNHYEMQKPGGAFYAFVKAPGDDASAFVKNAIAHNLLIIPGNVFSEKDTHFRISYAASDDTIARGIDILISLLNS